MREESKQKYLKAAKYAKTMGVEDACDKAGISVSGYYKTKNKLSGDKIEVVTHDTEPKKRKYKKRATGKAIVIVSEIDDLPNVLEKLR